MSKYIAGLISPSLGLMFESSTYHKVYEITANSKTQAAWIAEELLTRKFCQDFKTSLSEVVLGFVAKIKY